MMSGNPLFGDRLYQKVEVGVTGMTVKGTINRLAMLLAMTLITACWSWQQFRVDPGAGMLWAAGGAVLGLLLVLAMMFKRHLAAYLAPAYALAEGLFLGAISASFEQMYGGIVLQAVLLTFGVMFAMLFAYMTGIVKVTPGLMKAVFAATMGVAIYYLIAMVMGMFGAEAPLIHQSGPLGIAFSLVVIGIAAFNLVIDFAQIENAAQAGMPKYMEWYGAFALLVTLIWLYMEALRFLAKLRD
jgi:uncharacterized YccA/Bax inhibitor family protein